MLKQTINKRDLAMGSPTNERKKMNNKFDELTKSLTQSVTRRGALKKFGVGVAGAALACFLTISRSPAGADDGPSANAAAIRVTTGNEFALVPTSDPNVFGHPVDGVAQVSLMGNCHFHGEATIYLPTGPGQPIRTSAAAPGRLPPPMEQTA